MVQPHLEVADIFRDQGPAWRRDHALSLAQLKAMSAIERCRSAALGGHVLRCAQCDDVQIAYNSCRNRHCPKCQGSAARRWLEDRQTELLPVAYYHVVFTLPATVARIAYQNPTVVYNLLFKATTQTLRTIAADPRHLGVRIGMIAVLHTWGSALTHHPHLHCIVPGGGLDPDQRWKPCNNGFFLPVRVLSRLFRRLFLEQLMTLHPQLEFYGSLASLVDKNRLRSYLDPARNTQWIVYAKQPFSGPKTVLEYLSRYTHRVAISNRRIIDYDHHTVTFRYKDYRIKGNKRFKTMRLPANEFIRRFLIHILPSGFHRIRHFGLFANHQRTQNLQLIRHLLGEENTKASAPQLPDPTHQDKPPTFVCPTCGTPLVIIETFQRPYSPRGPPN